MDTFSHGEVFQCRVLGLCFREPRFLDVYGHLLKQDYFTVGTYGHLLLVVRDYYNRYKRAPDVETSRDITLQYAIRMRFSQILCTDLLTALEQVIHIDLSEARYVIDEVVNFVKQRELTSVVLECAEQLEGGDVKYDEVMSKVQKAISIGVSMDTGALFGEWAQDLTARLNNDNLFGDALRMKTHIPDLDEKALMGGLTPGQIAVVMGSSGRGKSMVLTALGAAALRDGYSVFHYTLELKQLDVVLRYAANITGVPMAEIRRGSAEYQARIAPWRDRPQKLMIKYFPMGSVSVSGLRSHMNHTMAQTGLRPALLIVDYADLLDLGMRGAGAEDQSRRSAALGDVYRDLISIGDEYNCGVWTASQVQRGSWAEDTVHPHHVSDSIKKVNNADVILTLCQTPAQKAEHKLRLYVAKNRRGEDGFEIPCVIDFARARVTQDRSAPALQRSGNGAEKPQFHEAETASAPQRTDAQAIAAAFKGSGLI